MEYGWYLWFFPDIVDCKEPCFTNIKAIWSFSEKLLSYQLILERTHSSLTVVPASLA